MAFIPAVNTARIAAEVNHASVGAVNVFYAEASQALDQAALDAVAAAVVGYYQNAAHLATVSSGTSFRRARVRDMTSINGLSVIAEGSGTVGTATGDPMPGSVTAVATLKTGIAGRSFRGRLYHIGLAEAQVSGQGLVAASRAALETEYERLRTVINAVTSGLTTFQLVVASFFTAGAPRASALLTPVNDVVVDAQIDSQTRRLRGAQFP